MKAWLIVTVITGLLVLGGLAVVQALDKQADQETDTSTNSEYATCGSPNCNGGCTEQNNCGISTCGAVSGRSCGCGR